MRKFRIIKHLNGASKTHINDTPNSDYYTLEEKVWYGWKTVQEYRGYYDGNDWETVILKSVEEAEEYAKQLNAPKPIKETIVVKIFTI